MALAESWLELLATTKAVFEATKAGIDLVSIIRKYRKDPETQAESQRVSSAFSTYTDEEIQSLTERMKACYHRFVQEGDGAKRTRCICNVFKDASDGNGGDLPHIDDWPKMFKKLKCRT